MRRLAAGRRWLIAGLLGAAAPAAAQQRSPAAAAVARLSDEYWRAELDRFPELATINGFRGPRNGGLTDISPAGFSAWDARLRRLSAALSAVDSSRLARADRVNLALLRDEVESALGARVCHRELWTVDQLNGPQVAFATLAALQPVGTAAERDAVLARWRRMGPYVDQYVRNLRRGLDSGYVAARINVERVADQIDRLLEQPADSSPFLAPVRRAGRAGAGAFADALRTVVRDRIHPALRRYRDFLRTDYLPRSREQPGVRGIPNGAACYTALIRLHTSLAIPAESLHQDGLAEVAAIRGEMAAIARRRFQAENLDSLLRALPRDTSLTFATRHDVFEAARDAVSRMERKLPELFDRLPRRRVVVEEMPAYQERDAPAAYYYQGTADGRRPGRYLVNTYEPRSRPRYTSEVLAYHEAVPGHHLQIALAQELPLPAFRRYGGGSNALIEGWALYTERLADEAGMYGGDLDRLGMLIFQSWRACRLVVDTGLHALGWSRRQAVDYLLHNTALSELDAENEVDRYIVDPGQALAYKVGQREILRLREEARRRLGARFDLRRFHDAVLRDGAVTLPVLAENVREWEQGQGGATGAQ
ncbi:MAG TPA: DUF885 domain-containing protein [Gemmatimonadales bacterium]|nr:DUF885 domain-containing protein [Gemmatimonadales bacterium]